VTTKLPATEQKHRIIPKKTNTKSTTTALVYIKLDLVKLTTWQPADCLAWHLQVPALMAGSATERTDLLEAGKMVAANVNTAPETANIQLPCGKNNKLLPQRWISSPRSIFAFTKETQLCSNICMFVIY